MCVQKEGKKAKRTTWFIVLLPYTFHMYVCRMRMDTCTYIYFNSERPHLDQT